MTKNPTYVPTLTDTLKLLERQTSAKFNADMLGAIALSEATGFDATATKARARIESEIAETPEQISRLQRDVIAILKAQQDYPAQDIDKKHLKALEATADQYDAIQRAKGGLDGIQSAYIAVFGNLTRGSDDISLREKVVDALKRMTSEIMRETLVPSAPVQPKDPREGGFVAMTGRREPSPELVELVTQIQKVQSPLQAKLMVAKFEDDVAAATRKAAGLSQTNTVAG